MPIEFFTNIATELLALPGVFTCLEAGIPNVTSCFPPEGGCLVNVVFLVSSVFAPRISSGEQPSVSCFAVCCLNFDDALPNRSWLGKSSGLIRHPHTHLSSRFSLLVPRSLLLSVSEIEDKCLAGSRI